MAITYETYASGYGRFLSGGDNWKLEAKIDSSLGNEVVAFRLTNATGLSIVVRIQAADTSAVPIYLHAPSGEAREHQVSAGLEWTYTTPPEITGLDEYQVQVLCI